MNDISMPTWRVSTGNTNTLAYIAFKLGSSYAAQNKVNDLLGLAVLGLGNHHVVSDLYACDDRQIYN
jgi:hypothetical protein